jgi:hypothetical protein
MYWCVKTRTERERDTHTNSKGGEKKEEGDVLRWRDAS